MKHLSPTLPLAAVAIALALPANAQDAPPADDTVTIGEGQASAVLILAEEAPNGDV